MQGWVDSPLTENGVEVAQFCGLGLQDIPFDVAYSSDLMRAIKTTKIMLSENNNKEIPHYTLFDLREISFGKFGGGYKTAYETACSKVLFGEENLELLNEKLHSTELTVKDLIDAGCSLDTSGKAENFSVFENRIVNCIKNIVEKAKEASHEKVLIVTHGLVIFALLNVLSAGCVQQIKDVKNASVSLLRIENNSIDIKEPVSMDYVSKGRMFSQK